jgi:hypothetical protein
VGSARRQRRTAPARALLDCPRGYVMLLLLFLPTGATRQRVDLTSLSQSCQKIFLLLVRSGLCDTAILPSLKEVCATGIRGWSQNERCSITRLWVLDSIDVVDVVDLGIEFHRTTPPERDALEASEPRQQRTLGCGLETPWTMHCSRFFEIIARLSRLSVMVTSCTVPPRQKRMLRRQQSPGSK